MPIGISEDHEALRLTARRWLEARCPPAVPRALLDSADEGLPPFWEELADQGWLGLHLPEDHGGQGFGLAELAVVLEELGRACAPGPFLPTVLASALISASGTDELRGELLSGLADGSVTAAVAFPGPGPEVGLLAAGEAAMTGVLGAAMAELVVLPVERGGGGRAWCAVDRSQLDVAPVASLDPTRRVASVSVRGEVPAGRVLGGLDDATVAELAATMLAAECAGGHGWCLETATAYAKVREQFGRPIGQFQAVKHRLADMLVSLEQSTATAWDAAQSVGSGRGGASLAAAVAGAVGPEAFANAAKDCIQVLGGIGFTWEHDAHLYLKRAISVRQLAGGTSAWRTRVAELVASGERRSLAAELLASLPTAESEAVRESVAPDAAALKTLDREQRVARMVELGYLVPHWPAPWGRDASAVEQLVIDDELERARVRRPHLQIGAWVLPTIIAHGTREQQDRWVLPTLLGKMSWCQMFSEPGAGSDLASLTTKAVRVEGGWCLSGQKVWTSMAAQADWAICLARTNPSVPKHDGITYFIVDMRSQGLEVRPLRELTGAAMFNEVFLSDVFVPDDCVIGEVDDGWRLARTTLANERVSMSNSSFGGGIEALIARDLAGGRACDPVVTERVGALVAEAQSLALLGHRATLRSLSGVDPGPGSSVRKLLGVEHDQRVQEEGLVELGSAGATSEGEPGSWSFGFLANRCLTIAGGTSEVQRNLIAERLLGLPRDPEPGD